MRFEGDRLWRCFASKYQRLPDKEDDAKDVLDAGQINAHEGAKVSLQYIWRQIIFTQTDRCC